MPLSYNTTFVQNIVNGIDSVWVGGNYRKRYCLSQDSLNTPIDTLYSIIEGIGSSYGLLNQIVKPFENGSSFYCYEHNGIKYPTWTNCVNNLSINEQRKNSSSIDIYPNPFTTETTIHSLIQFTSATLTIYNSIGELKLKQTSLSGNSIKLNRDNLSNGIYLIYLTQDTKILGVNKLVLTDRE